MSTNEGWMASAARSLNFPKTRHLCTSIASNAVTAQITSLLYGAAQCGHESFLKEKPGALKTIN